MMWSQELMVEEANGYRQGYDVVAVCVSYGGFYRVTFHFQKNMAFPYNPVTASREVNGRNVPFSRSYVSNDEQHVMATIDVREGEYIEVEFTTDRPAVLQLRDGQLTMVESNGVIVGLL